MSATANVVIVYNVGIDNNAVNGNIADYAPDMPERQPYHHGNLRAALLTAAERTLRDHGIEQVSLRDLARQAGVSHGAPSRHFRDRQALLNALADVGYVRLGDAITAAVRNAGHDFAARLRAVAASYVRFAVDNAALLDLMLATGKADETGAVFTGPQRPYAILKELIQHGHETGELRPGDPERLQLIILVTFQGIAALVSSGKIPVAQTDAFIDEATALFVRPG
jgi:AcrR family transcriptional regulator